MSLLSALSEKSLYIIFNPLPQKKPVENIVGKRENAGHNQHFLLFPTMFSTFPKTNFNFSVTFILLAAKAFDMYKFKNFSFGKELTGSFITRVVCFKLGQVINYQKGIPYSKGR